jgi:hypothetical protein
MLCCLAAALFAGNFALAGRVFASFVTKRTAAAGLALAFLAGGAAILAPVAAAHADHYGARAEAHGRSILAEILAPPLCSGGGETS